ncbi:hypothetical protein CAPTEDRAFT_79139, partial [Capitella teleta]
MQCPLCFRLYCSLCFDAYHGWWSCESARKSSKMTTKINAWMSEDKDGRKKCPKCRIVIEKNGGCNRMICSVCSRIFCWVC